MRFLTKSVMFCAITLGSNWAIAADESEMCIHTSHLNHTEIIDAQTILFHMNGKKTYINRLPNRCPGLSFHKAFSYKTRVNKLCSSDIIRVFQGDYFGAACGLGRFEEYDAEAAEAAEKEGALDLAKG